VLPGVQCGATEPARGEVGPRLQRVIATYRGRIPELMKEQRVPGLALVLIFDGRVVWSEGFGIADDSGRPITGDTPFSIQSISKTYTATAVMIGVAEGRLDLDEPITTYLPDFTVNSRFESHPEQRITLRLLLSHRSGLTHEAPIGNNYDDRTRSFRDHVRSISDTWLRFPVGRGHAYSNLGMDLAGHLLEVVYRRPYPEVMRDKLFRPLGLIRTTADQDEIEAMKDKASGHSALHSRVPVRIAMVPAGGIYTTANDMARFLQIHLHGGPPGVTSLLPASHVDAMHAPCCDAIESSYGLGMAEATGRFANTEVISRGHSGVGLGFKADMYWFSELGLGIGILTNSEDHRLQGSLYSSLSRDILEEFIGKASADAEDSVRPSVEVPEKRLRQLAGLYVGTPSIELAIVDRKLGWKSRNGFHLATFRSAEEIEVATPSATLRCRFRSDGIRDPAWADCTVAVGAMRMAGSLAHNGSPFDPVGVEQPTWSRYVGEYDLLQWGKVVEAIRIRTENGYLYCGSARVVAEHQPGLFFLADGEALDLRTDHPSLRNIGLTRRSDPQPRVIGAH
jgi:CubicO group peptidase (beta-lactamase class C family)